MLSFLNGVDKRQIYTSAACQWALTSSLTSSFVMQTPAVHTLAKLMRYVSYFIMTRLWRHRRGWRQTSSITNATRIVGSHCPHTMTKASCPRNRKGCWSIMVWTMSSRYGRVISKRPMSENWTGSRVGHQHIAKFLLSIEFNFELSATLAKCSSK